MRVTTFRHAETIVFGITTVLLLVAAIWNANATAAAKNAVEEIKQIQQQEEIAANEEEIAANEEARMIKAAALKIDAAATPEAVEKQVKILKTEISLQHGQALASKMATTQAMSTQKAKVGNSANRTKLEYS